MARAAPRLGAVLGYSLPAQGAFPAMSEYEVTSYTVEPVEGDDQIAITIHASDGNKWEYGVPYSRSTGRYTFEEIDVLEADFGEEFAEELSEKLDEVMEKVMKDS